MKLVDNEEFWVILAIGAAIGMIILSFGVAHRLTSYKDRDFIQAGYSQQVDKETKRIIWVKQ